ncbi:hypothetical protein Trydic_g12973 [Trypoxylus dichotomus]
MIHCYIVIQVKINIMNQSMGCPRNQINSATSKIEEPTTCKRIINTSNAPQAVGPYNQAIVFDKTVYVSGCLGLNKDTMKLVEGGVKAETKQALTSLGHILQAAGSSYANVLKTTVYLGNIDDFAAVNEVYKEFFAKDFPARSCFQVAKLPLGARVEIEAIAGFWGWASIWGIGIVRFQNGVCPGADGLDGTCYTKRQCSDISGVASGSCASNIGVCCVLQRTCGATSSYNNTYFVNPAFPSTMTTGGVCTFIIQKCNPSICQVRIDFLTLTLAQPDANGNCINDAMNIVGGGANIPTICGENSGLHVYVDFNGDANIKIVISTSSDTSVARSWKLKIAQIACDCPTRAPSGCLMYYTDLSGTVRSFNYGTTVSSYLLPSGQPGTRQLANTNYGICVRMVPGYCGIQWSQGSDSVSFTVSGDTTAAVGLGIVGAPASYMNGASCSTDFIVVPDPSINGVPANTDRFCGNGLPALTTYSKPFVLTTVTDGNELPDSGNRGFALSYTQLRCANIIMVITNHTSLDRRGKILPLWGWGIGLVRFENSICSSSDFLSGTCYTKYQCSQITGGVASGYCASNLGVCCLVILGCGTSSSLNNTYFVNTGYPTAYSGSGSCTYTIKQCNPNICQVRIDFLTLSLAQPDANGTCAYDSLNIVGGASQVPTICGENSGQHVYLDFYEGGDITISITTSSSVDFQRFWNIQVAQLDCGCPSLAPSGCLMYYTDVSGTVNSFNYGTTANGALLATNDRPGTRQLVNQNYGICVGNQPGFCSITWSQTGDPYSFTVTGDTIGLSVDPGLPNGSYNGTSCTTDYVVIPNPFGVNADRFCGNAFPTVTSASKPFILTVVTDGNEVDDIVKQAQIAPFQAEKANFWVWALALYNLLIVYAWDRMVCQELVTENDNAAKSREVLLQELVQANLVYVALCNLVVERHLHLIIHTSLMADFLLLIMAPLVACTLLKDVIQIFIRAQTCFFDELTNPFTPFTSQSYSDFNVA